MLRASGGYRLLPCLGGLGCAWLPGLGGLGFAWLVTVFKRKSLEGSDQEALGSSSRLSCDHKVSTSDMGSVGGDFLWNLQ